MGGFEELSFSAENFDGKVRVFPLPNLVLFPHVMQPLHIFEPRYRAMLAEALAGDGLIAMAVLAPGWEADYDGRPPIHRMACLGRVTSSHRLEDGTFNVLLLGLCRIRIVEELPAEKSFREAKVEVCGDHAPPHAAAELAALHRRVREAFLKIAPLLPEAQEQLDQILGGDVPLGVLTDVIGYMLDLAVAEKEALLAECDVQRRAERLLTHLSAAAADLDFHRRGPAGFPLQFSVN